MKLSKIIGKPLKHGAWLLLCLFVYYDYISFFSNLQQEKLNLLNVVGLHKMRCSNLYVLDNFFYALRR